MGNLEAGIRSALLHTTESHNNTVSYGYLYDSFG